MNYAELVTAVSDYCENSFPTTDMNTFIRQAEQRIYNTAQPANLRKNVTGVLTTGNKYLQCPTDFLSVYSLAVYPYNTTTATGSSGAKTIVVASATGIAVGQQATGTGIGDPIGASAGAATSYMYDGLHPAIRGAYWMGIALADAIANTQQSTRATFFTNPADLYHSTDNPSGNLLTNGAFIGTGGALAGGATGSVADSFTLQKTAGAGTVVGSKGTEAVSNGTTYATQIITTAGAAIGKLYEQLYTPASFAVNDIVYAECEVNVSSATNLLGISLQTDAGTEVGRSMHYGTYYWPDGSYTVRLRTPNITVTSIAAVTWFVLVETAAGGGAAVEILSAAWRHAD